ncbi:hypothetical protein ABPG74_017868 [Tetrahymena malaccensis]
MDLFQGIKTIKNEQKQQQQINTLINKSKKLKQPYQKKFIFQVITIVIIVSYTMSSHQSHHKKFTETEVAHLISEIVRNNQEHLLKNIDELNEQELHLYYQDLKQLDFKLLHSLYQTYIVQNQAPTTFNDDQVTLVEEILSLEQQTGQLLNELQLLGLEAIAKGEVAVILLAGGQGTRLGYDKPKGMLPLEVPSKRSIFSYYADKIKTLSNYALSKFPQYKKENDAHGRQRIPIQFYLMTSVVTDQDTKDFFKAHDYFGISEDSIHYFVQGYLPSLDKKGKILFESKNKIFLSPNGNGGIYDSLQSTGVLKKLNDQKIKYIQMMGVDNILGKFADPEQVGLMVKKGYEIVSKYAKKRNAAESVGIHVLRDKKFSIMEYSDMTEAQKNKVDANGKLVYDKSFLCNFFCSIDFLNRIINDEHAKKELFQYHLANKQVAYYDVDQKQVVKPAEKNAYKFELFIFDSFPLAKTFCLMEINREEQFAPIKNSVTGSPQDNPRTAVEQLAKLHQKWLINAGYTFDYQASWENVVEVDPKISYYGENIPAPTDANKHITAKPFYLK